MFTHPQQGLDHDDVLRLRQEAGRWLRSLREATGYSQRGLASAVGLPNYTFISQVEAGRCRIPPAQTREWAKALYQPVRDFAIKLMEFYDPLNYDLIFREQIETELPEVDNRSLEQRIAKLENLLSKPLRRRR